MDVDVACICPGSRKTPHDRDTITLLDRLDFRTAIAIRKSMGLSASDDERGRSLEILSLLTEAYVLFGIAAWTVADHEGPVPVSHANIRTHLLANLEAAGTVADAADGLYNPVVLLPLLQRAAMSSQPTSTSELTSATNGSGPKHRKRSSRSSTTNTPTDDTATTSTSSDGGSSTSLSEASDS